MAKSHGLTFLLNKNSSYKKSKYFDAYNVIYSMNKFGRFLLCEKCRDVPCERSTSEDDVLLLPFESQFISQNLRKKGSCSDIRTIRGIQTSNNKCPFFIKKRCRVHSFRPIDCRSFPLVPVFNNGFFTLKISSSCSFGDRISQSFYDEMKVMWVKLLPVLSESWKKSYNKMISAYALKKLPSHINMGNT